jgi:hypothetical protein
MSNLIHIQMEIKMPQRSVDKPHWLSFRRIGRFKQGRGIETRKELGQRVRGTTEQNMPKTCLWYFHI